MREREGPPVPAAPAAPRFAGVEEPRVRGAGGVGAEAERERELQLVGLLGLLSPALAGRRPAGSRRRGRRSGRRDARGRGGGLEVEGVVAGGGDGAPGAVAAAAGLALQDGRGRRPGGVVGELGEEGVGGAAGGAGGQVHGGGGGGRGQTLCGVGVARRRGGGSVPPERQAGSFGGD